MFYTKIVWKMALFRTKMKRFISKTLRNWKEKKTRTPLILRGARQVGKTYSVQEFATSEFADSLTINFETSQAYYSCFNTLNPLEIISQIELLSKQKIIPGKTLLFFDEIQQCPKALQSLRYFKEQMEDLHIIAAGSLLEFAIHDEEFSFPVGRVQFARLFPLCFEEFLCALGDEQLQQALTSYNLSQLPPLSIHQHLLKRVQEYFILGGMPSVVEAYVETQKFLEAQYRQQSLLDAFENDFGKYAKKSQHRHLKKIFIETPRLLGSHVKYSRIDPDIPNPAREMKKAIELLELAGLVHPIFATSAGNIPLLSGLKESIFKLIFLDIGLVGKAMNIEPNFPGLMTGPLAEQFVGEELLAMNDPLLEEKLFFWARENGSAEVDYLFSHKGVIYPIEVKAGKSGKLKSLYLFLAEKKTPFGIKVSPEPLAYENGILSVPFYLLSHLPRLIDSLKCF
jgi:uncharacterized protein